MEHIAIDPEIERKLARSLKQIREGAENHYAALAKLLDACPELRANAEVMDYIETEMSEQEKTIFDPMYILDRRKSGK